MRGTEAFNPQAAFKRYVAKSKAIKERDKGNCEIIRHRKSKAANAL